MVSPEERMALWQRHAAEHPTPLSWETFKRAIVPGATPEEILEIAAQRASKRALWKRRQFLA